MLAKREAQSKFAYKLVNDRENHAKFQPSFKDYGHLDARTQP
jgi:hypothetical protein